MQSSSNLSSSSSFHAASINSTEASDLKAKVKDLLQEASASGRKIYLVGKGSAVELKAMSNLEAKKTWVTSGSNVHLVSKEMITQLQDKIEPKTTGPINLNYYVSSAKIASTKDKPTQKAQKLFEAFISQLENKAQVLQSPTKSTSWIRAQTPQTPAAIIGKLTSKTGVTPNKTPPSGQVAATLSKQKDMKTDGKYAAPALHLSNMDSNMVKGGRVGFAVRNIDGQNKVAINFQMTRTGINALNEGAQQLESQGIPEVSIKKGDFVYFSSENGAIDTKNGQSMNAGEAIIIEIKGVGKVIVGDQSDEYHALHGEVNVILAPGVDVKDAGKVLNQVFALLGVEGVVSDASPVDTERLKMMSMFQILYPNKVSELPKNHLELAPQALKSAMIKLAPNLKDNFDTQLGKMYLQEVRPGQKEWALKGIADEMRKAGAMGLMAGTSVNSAILMMQGGALSSHERFSDGRIIAGASSLEDLQRGGGRHVFTRVITNDLSKNEIKKGGWENFSFAGDCQLLYDLDVAERVCYMYDSDKFGNKEPYDYDNRRDIVTTTKGLTSNDKSNELMVKGRIPPENVRGMVVQTPENKKALIEGLTKAGLVDKDGKINGKPVDEFIIVGNKFEKKFWNKPGEQMVQSQAKTPVSEKGTVQAQNDALAGFDAENEQKLISEIVTPNGLEISLGMAKQYLKALPEGSTLLRFSNNTQQFILTTEKGSKALTGEQTEVLLSQGIEGLKKEIPGLMTPKEAKLAQTASKPAPTAPTLEELPILNSDFATKFVKDLKPGEFILRRSNTGEAKGKYVFTGKNDKGQIVKGLADDVESLKDVLKLKKLKSPVAFTLNPENIPTKDEAANAIASLQPGQFTVRQSSSEPGSVVFVVKSSDGEVKENLVQSKNLGMGIEHFGGMGKLVM